MGVEVSASLSWEPVQRKTHPLAIGAPSAFREALTEAGIDQGMSAADLPALRGIRAGAGRESDWREAVDSLIEGIEKYGEIVLRVEY